MSLEKPIAPLTHTLLPVQSLKRLNRAGNDIKKESHSVSKALGLRETTIFTLVHPHQNPV